MKLNLKNPIVFFDLETTGTNINTDRIVEICYLKVYPNGNEETKTMRINPEMHIPEQSSAIHGIYDADVADCPTFKEVAKEIARDIEGCDLAGFNSNRFDIPVLAEEFLRAGVDIDMMKRKFIDVQVIYHKLEQRTLSAAYKFYCGKNLEDAHTAEADTRATYEVLKSQLDRYPEELQNDMAFLAEYSSFNKNVDFAGRIVYDASFTTLPWASFTSSQTMRPAKSTLSFCLEKSASSSILLLSTRSGSSCTPGAYLSSSPMSTR